MKSARNKWNHTESFKHFGTTPRNINWSWSARNEDTKTVVLTLWQDRFKKEEGKLTYIGPGLDASKRTSPGLPEMIQNLVWAREHCDGKFHVISAKPKDPKAQPRSIDECFPTKMVMQLLELNEHTGAFRAVLVES
ncbi:MAG TPA: hypothetical protein VFB16_05735 [Bauldia sp.]|nr:hypothetical protein [Bauldia sp.]